MSIYADVVPNDDNDLPSPAIKLSVTVGGHVTALLTGQPEEASAVIYLCKDGDEFDAPVRRVKRTGTTATGIKALVSDAEEAA